MQSKPTQAHGPYIVTVRHPDLPACQEPERSALVDGDRIPGEASRRAVATLEDAREAALDATVREGDYWIGPVVEACETLPEAGGTVALTDGTVIEVEPVTWGRLAESVGQFDAGHELARDEVIAAYNAAQAEGLMT